MKKIYKVNVEKCDACEGKYTYTEAEYVTEAYIEAKRVEIENRPYWWMDHRKVYEGENEGRPLVTAEEIEVREV